jgi:N-acetylneuraminic acid mutarotase
MPTSRSSPAVAAYENRIYVIGGDTPQGVTDKVEGYDTEQNRWQVLSPKPTAVSDVAAAMIGGKIYIPGGRLKSGDITKLLEIYDPRQDRWEQGAELPLTLSAYAMIAFEGRLYLFGGWDGKQYLNTVLVYDISRDRWSFQTPMPTRRGYAGIASVNGKIYVMGGFNGQNALTVNEVYYPERDQGSDSPWSRAAKLPAGRYAMGEASLTDLIYIIGGKGDIGTLLTPVIYIPQSDSWLTFDKPPTNIGDSLGLVPFGNFLFVIGGRIAQETSNYTLAYQAIYTIVIPVLR